MRMAQIVCDVLKKSFLLTSLCLLSSYSNAQGSHRDDTAEITISEQFANQFNEYDNGTDSLSDHFFSMDHSQYCYCEGLLRIRRNNKWGFINTTGEEVVSCQYDDVKDFSDGVAAVCKGGKWGYIDKNGTEVIPCQYEGYVGDFNDGYATIRDGIIDKNGRIQKADVSYWPFSEGLSVFWKWIGNKQYMGYINIKGEIVIPCRYDDGLSFSEGYAVVAKNNKYGYINTKGEQVIPFIYDSAESFNEGFAAVNKGGDALGTWGFVNTQGREVISCEYYRSGSGVIGFHDGLSAIMRSDKGWKSGYINTEGIEVIPCKYDEVRDFHEGCAAVCRNGKWGYINTKGEEIIACVYDKAENFNNGIAAVFYILQGHYFCGLIDKQGNHTFTSKLMEYIDEFLKKKKEEENSHMPIDDVAA